MKGTLLKNPNLPNFRLILNNVVIKIIAFINEII